jgi:hypothetical protein
VSTTRHTRELFVERLLVAPSEPLLEPMARYDDERHLTVVEDGTPLVETVGTGGTETLTKATGERSDADSALAVGTSTHTAVRAEREDDDASMQLWCGTQLDTRKLPADVKTD